MQWTLLILLFFSTLELYVAQSKRDIVISNALNAQSLEELNQNNESYFFKKAHDNQLNHDLVQTNWMLYKKSKSQMIGLLTISMKDVIIYSEAYEIKLNNTFDGYVHNTIDHTSNDIFDSLNVNLTHLVKLPERTTFGYACGTDGQMPNEGKHMSNMVDNKDFATLFLWLESINPIKQAYAYTAFKKLEADGHQLKIEIIKKMESLEKSLVDIHFCSGSVFFQSKPFAEAIGTDYITNYLTN